jgi:hypothetical protein
MANQLQKFWEIKKVLKPCYTLQWNTSKAIYLKFGMAGN